MMPEPCNSAASSGHRRSRPVGGALSGITAVQILVSFGMQWYVVSQFGARMQADAFYAAATLPQIASVLLIDSLPLVLVPMLSSLSIDELREDVWQMLMVTCAALLLLSGALAVATGVLVPVLVPGFSAPAKVLTVNLTRIQLCGLTGAGATAVLTALHQVRNRFLAPPIAMLVSNLAAIAFLLFYMKTGGITVAAWAQVIAAAAPALLLVSDAGLPRICRWNRSWLREVWRLLLPVVLGKAYYLTSAPIDRLLASFLPPGTLVMFELVSRFYAAVQRVLLQGIMTPFLPQLSRLAAMSHWRDFKDLYYSQCRLTLLFSSVAVAVTEVGVLWVLPSLPRVPGAVAASDLERMAAIIACMGGVLPGLTLVNVLTNAFYSQGDTYTPTRIGAVAYTAGLALRFAGFGLAGIKGMAFAATAWVFLHCLLLHVVLRRRTQRLITGSDAGMIQFAGVEEV
jgi:putative peptidoglycan lipid II flippase